MDTLVNIVAYSVGGLVAYMLLVNRLNHFLRPFRMDLAERGGRILANPGLAEAERDFLTFALDNAFNSRLVPVAALVLPFALAISAIKGTGPEDRRLGVSEARVVAFKALGSMAASNPLFGLIILLELVVFALVLLMIGRTTRGFQRIIVATLGRLGHSQSHSHP